MQSLPSVLSLLQSNMPVPVPLQCVIEMRSFGISLRSKRSSTGPYLHGFHQRRGVWALLASALCLAVPHNQLSAAPSEPSLENLKAKCNQ